MFSYIKEKFPSVKRQYKDNIRYPWRCDFYIPELDYFIEIQGYYTHNTHPYNPNSILDQVLVQRYKERYGPKMSGNHYMDNKRSRKERLR